MISVSRLNRTLRGYLVWQHRVTGLLMTVFLVIVAVTGSILALKPMATRVLHPELFVRQSKATPRMSLGELAQKTEAHFPHAQVWFISYAPGQAHAVITPRTDPVTMKAYELPFNSVDLDPYSGRLLGTEGEGCHPDSSPGFMATVYSLHTNLASGAWGATILGYVAIVWTIDCFVGFYLTLPVSNRGFWQNWRIAWKMKHQGGLFRFIFDLHRAGGLWLWPLLFILAWSSVLVARADVYDLVMRRLFAYRDDLELILEVPVEERASPKMSWVSAQRAGDELFAAIAQKQHLKLYEPQSLAFIGRNNAFGYAMVTSDSFRYSQPDSVVWFSADDGKLLQYFPARGNSGKTISHALTAMHLGDFYGESYRYVEAVAGLGITGLTVTGVWIWWRKRRARRRRGVAPGKLPAAVIDSQISAVRPGARPLRAEPTDQA